MTPPAAVELRRLHINLFLVGFLQQQLPSFFLRGQCQHPRSHLVQTLYCVWVRVSGFVSCNRLHNKTQCTRRPEAVFIKSITAQWWKRKEEGRMCLSITLCWKEVNLLFFCFDAVLAVSNPRWLSDIWTIFIKTLTLSFVCDASGSITPLTLSWRSHACHHVAGHVWVISHVNSILKRCETAWDEMRGQQSPSVIGLQVLFCSVSVLVDGFFTLRSRFFLITLDSVDNPALRIDRGCFLCGWMSVLVGWGVVFLGMCSFRAWWTYDF